MVGFFAAWACFFRDGKREERKKGREGERKERGSKRRTSFFFFHLGKEARCSSRRDENPPLGGSLPPLQSLSTCSSGEIIFKMTRQSSRERKKRAKGTASEGGQLEREAAATGSDGSLRGPVFFGSLSDAPRTQKKLLTCSFAIISTRSFCQTPTHLEARGFVRRGRRKR